MSKDSRKITSQLKKLKEVFGDIVRHSELLEQDGIRTEVSKGFTIIKEMEEANESKRDGE